MQQFYCIPKHIEKEMQKAIYDYVKYPRKTIAQAEMWKMKGNGGIKMINIAIKSQTAKAKWLIDMIENENLKLNLQIFTHILGDQKGSISGGDIIFSSNSFFKKHLKTGNKFYKEALLSLGNLDTRKGISTLNHWDKEHIFFNPLFTTKNGNILNMDTYCENKKIFRYDQLIEEKRKQLARDPHDKVLVKLLDKIVVDTQVRKENILVSSNGEEIKFKEITQKVLYEETLLKKCSQDHHSAAKWVRKLNTVILWKDVWNTVHNILSSNKTKTIIWQQIHLNFYTQYSYNKWYKKQDRCPLCQEIPINIFHIMLHCNFTFLIWKRLEPKLLHLSPIPLSENEMAFGIVQDKKGNGILLRNWITFMLREAIMEEERRAYHASTKPNITRFLQKFNTSLKFEINSKIWRYKNENRSPFFDKIITHNELLCKKMENGEYEIKGLFQ